MRELQLNSALLVPIVVLNLVAVRSLRPDFVANCFIAEGREFPGNTGVTPVCILRLVLVVSVFSFDSALPPSFTLSSNLSSANSSRSSLSCCNWYSVLLPSPVFTFASSCSWTCVSADLMLNSSSAETVTSSGLLSRSDNCLPGKTRAISGRHSSQSGSSTKTRSRSFLASAIC